MYRCIRVANWSQSRVLAIKYSKPLVLNHLVSKNLSIPGAYAVLHICSISALTLSGILDDGAGAGGLYPLMHNNSSIFVLLAKRIVSPLHSVFCCGIQAFASLTSMTILIICVWTCARTATTMRSFTQSWVYRGASVVRRRGRVVRRSTWLPIWRVTLRWWRI